MIRLPADVSRCAGRQPAGICPERESCARYRCSGPRCSPVPLPQWLCDDASFAQRIAIEDLDEQQETA